MKLRHEGRPFLGWEHLGYSLNQEKKEAGSDKEISANTTAG